MKPTALDRAIRAATSGVALARLLDVSPMTISQWKVRGVPAKRVLSIEQATGVSRHELRPDIYPADPPQAPVVTDSFCGA